MTGEEGICKKCARIDCCCHLISTILKRVLYKAKMKDEQGNDVRKYRYFGDSPDVYHLIDGCSKLVDHVKRSG
jgi:hypothetical protein